MNDDAQLQKLRDADPTYHSNPDKAKINAILLEKMQERPIPDETRQAAVQAINDFTRRKMYILEHIPTLYFIPCEQSKRDFPAMMEEINKRGCIHLDSEGRPCCLSGNDPVIPYEETSDEP